MAGSINKVILIGNVGKKPEIRRTTAGDPVASFSLATTENWNDRNSGERKEKTEWHNIVVFNKGLVKVIENYVEKGTKLYIEGQLQTRKWQDKDGNDRYTTEIVLQAYRGEFQILSSKGSTNKSSYTDDNGHTSDGGYNQDSQTNYENELDDEIPI